MPKRNKSKQQSIKNSYFSNIVHMNDDDGAYCGARVDGNLRNKDPQEVNCNKCLHFLEHPSLRDSKLKREKAVEKKTVEPIFS